MHFVIHSTKTKNFLRSLPYSTVRADWDSRIDKAKKFDTPTDALNAIGKLSETSKPHIVLFDGINTWNVSESKA